MTTKTEKTLTVEYFASLREERGCHKEDVATTAATAQEFFDELRQRYDFSLDAERLKVVVNEEFRDWAYVLQDGDSVVFIPPVAGG